MKKLLLTTTLLTACGLSAFAQSKFTTGNNNNIPVVFSAPGTALDGVKVQSATVHGGNHWAALYANGAQVLANTRIGVAAGVAGLFNFGALTMANTPDNTAVSFQVKAWRESDPGIKGESVTRDIKGAALQAGVIFGTTEDKIGGFAIVIPEPTSIMLAGLGLSGLLVLRRRK